LLEAEIFVPLSDRVTEDRPLIRQIVASLQDSASLNFFTMPVDDRKVLPIFTSAESALEWGQERFVLSSIPFQLLLDLAPGDLWYHLNPGDEVGKEFSPWELERLKLGAEAIDEILSEIDDSAGNPFEIDRQPEHLQALRQHLMTTLEVYAEIQEAFLVSVRSDPQDPERAVIGFRGERLSEARLTAIRTELVDLVTQLLGHPSAFVIVANIDDRRDPNAALFDECTPFFFRASFPSTSFLARLWGRLFNRDGLR